MAGDPGEGRFNYAPDTHRYQQLQSSSANPLPVSNQLIQTGAALFAMERNRSGYNRTRINYAREQHETETCASTATAS